MSDDSILARLDRLESIEAIRNCLHQYARAIDRRDGKLIDSIFWPDSKVEYGIYKGTGGEFSGLIHEWMDNGFKLTDHLLGNVTITIEGDRAHSETYLLAFHHLTREDGSVFDWLVGGRYQDRFERRNGAWRIAFRRLVYDRYRQWDDTRHRAVGLIGVPSAPAHTGTPHPRGCLSTDTVLSRVDCSPARPCRPQTRWRQH